MLILLPFYPIVVLWWTDYDALFFLVPNNKWSIILIIALLASMNVLYTKHNWSSMNQHETLLTKALTLKCEPKKVKWTSRISQISDKLIKEMKQYKRQWMLLGKVG